MNNQPLKTGNEELGATLSRAIFNQMAVGMAQVDLEGRWIQVNQKLCDIVGYGREEMRGLTFQDITHPDDLGGDLALAGKLLSGEIETYNLEKRYIHRAGHSVWVNLTATLEREAGTGRPLWYIAIIQEIAARRAAEHALQEKETFLASIYEGVEEAIFVVDVMPRPDEFLFVSVNPAYGRTLRRFGLPPDAIVGLSTESLKKYLPAEAVNGMHKSYRRCIETGRPMEYEETMPWEGRTTHWLTRLQPLHDAQGKVYRIIGTSHEITHQKEALEKIRQTEEHLRQAQKMEAVGRLAGGIAHDFNNLLTAINGYGDLVVGLLSPESTEYGFMKEIRNAGNRAASLTQQLLAFSRKQVLAPKRVDLNAVLTELATLLKRLIGEDIVLETLPAADLVQVLADPGQIEQVIMNLALNARDAIMPEGGRLTLETAMVELDPDAPGMDAPPARGWYAMLAVKDTGKGMDADILSRVFEPFFTTKPTGEGTGLGLSIVYGIVKQSGGHIQVTSETGRGSTFRVYFPLAGRSAVDGRMPGAGEAGGTGEGCETVLVVEDEESVINLVKTILAGAGYHVLAARNGQDALRAAEACAGPIHLLLTDVVMEKMGGRELAEQLRAKRPGMKIVFMSGYTDDTVLRHGVEEARTEFLPKPFPPQQLLRKVRRILNSEKS